MIIGIQAALLCERYTVSEQGDTSYINIIGEGLRCGSIPDLQSVCICLHLVLDGRPGEGEVVVSAPGGFKEPFPFRVPADMSLTGVLLPMAIPIVEEGELHVVVRNTKPTGGRDVRVKFGLAFSKDACAVPTANPVHVVADAAKVAELLREELMSRHRLN